LSRQDTSASGRNGSALASPLWNWALALGGIAVAVGLFLLCFERVDVERERPPGAAARRDPYLAAERLMSRAGFQVRSFATPRDLPWPPPLDATLILPTARTTVSEARSSEILEWVRAGGHLVVVTYSLFDDLFRTPDPILDPLGLEQYQNRQGDVPSETVAEVYFDGSGDAPLRMRVQPQFFWDEPERDLHLSVESEYGLHLVEVQEGKGFVTALTDNVFMFNENIGELDHAEIALRLFGLQAKQRAGAQLGGGLPVWFVTRDEPAPPYLTIWEHTWTLFVGVGALILAWVLMASQRFGPPIWLDRSVRRSLMEHVEASGRFLWRQGSRGRLVAVERRALLERVRARHPAWLGLEPAELHRRLASLARMPEDEVAQLMRWPEKQSPSPEDLVANLRALQRISNAL